MKVLFCIREDYYRNFAGDSMQLIKTVKYLKKKNVDVDINTGNIYNYSNYDIVHLFNIIRMKDTYIYYRIAKYYGKIIVLSPIYWNLEKYYRFIKDEHSILLWNKGNLKRREILEGCDMIYPNSQLEGEILCKDFSINIPYTVVYNGIEANCNIPKFNFKKKYGLKDYILCSARICRRKNQIVLSKLSKYFNYKFVFIGNVNDKKYFEECMKYKNVKYLGFMNRYNLYNAYRYAKVHILPSYIETPGLSSLEAASAGCNIISTIEGSSVEYFRDKCVYCDPYDEHSVKRSLEIALNKKRDYKLKKYIDLNYNWSKCIDKLYESYKKLIK